MRTLTAPVLDVRLRVDSVHGMAKEREVDVVGWITFVVDDGSDNIGAVITFAAAAVVILGIVVQRKGLSTLQ